MQADGNGTWRDTFDELLVLEQDFDTVMQTMIFQDEKLARLSLENPQRTRRQRTRNASDEEALIRCKPRGLSRKRRLAIREVAPRRKPPPVRVPHVTETTRAVPNARLNKFSRQVDADEKVGCVGVLEVVDNGASYSVDSLSHCCTGYEKQVLASSLNLNEQMLIEGSDLQAESNKRLADSMMQHNVVVRGDCANLEQVTKNCSTGFGKQARISKAKLDAYEKWLTKDDISFTATTDDRSAKSIKQLDSGIKSHFGAVDGNVTGHTRGADCDQDAKSKLVTSLFSTGSGKQISISKAKLVAYEEKLMNEDGGFSTNSNNRSADSSKQLGSDTKISFGDGHDYVTGRTRGADRGQDTNSKLVDEDIGVIITSNDRSADNFKRIDSDLNNDFSANCGKVAGHTRGADCNKDAKSEGVTSRLRTGSGEQVPISKEKVDAYEKQLVNQNTGVASASEKHPTDSIKQLGSGMKSDFGGGQGNVTGHSTGATCVQDADSELVTSLFSTGSGKQVPISKAKLDVFEKQVMIEDIGVILTSNNQSAGSDKHLDSGVNIDFGAGRGNVTGYTRGADCDQDAKVIQVTSLFCTASGKQVSISKASLDAYGKQLNKEDTGVITTSNDWSADSIKQLDSGVNIDVGAGCGNATDHTRGADCDQNAKCKQVTSLFCTASGKQVSISKAKLDAYGKQLNKEDTGVITTPNDWSAGSIKHLDLGVNIDFGSGRGNATDHTRGADCDQDAKLKQVISLFCTASGKQVSISKAKLDAYGKQLIKEDSGVILTFNDRSADSIKQLDSGVNIDVGAGCGNATDHTRGADCDQNANFKQVNSLFCTASGKQVSVSKAKLDAYGKQLIEEDTGVVSTSNDRSAGSIKQLDLGVNIDVGAGCSNATDYTRGADCGQDANLKQVTNLFCTASGKQVSISKAKLDAYGKQLTKEDSGVISTSNDRSADSIKQLDSGVNIDVGAGCGNATDYTRGADCDQNANFKQVNSLFCTASGKQVSVSKAKLDAYGKQLIEEDTGVISTSNDRSAGSIKQLDLGVNIDVGAGCSNATDYTRGADCGQDANLKQVTSLFCTASGKQVLISKAKLDAYGKQLIKEDTSGISTLNDRSADSIKQLDSGVNIDIGAGRGNVTGHTWGGDCGRDADSKLVTSLFSTGSGKPVSIPKAKFDAYEKQLMNEDTSVISISNNRSADSIKQLGSDINIDFSGGRANVTGHTRGGDCVQDADSKVVTLFSTGSGKQVLISNQKLDAYEKKIFKEDSGFTTTANDQVADNSEQFDLECKTGLQNEHVDSNADVDIAVRGQCAGSEQSTSLFCAGSGKQVLRSKRKLNAYEKKKVNEVSDISVTSNSSSADSIEQLNSGNKASVGACYASLNAHVGGVECNKGAESGPVTSYASTGSSKQLLISSTVSCLADTIKQLDASIETGIKTFDVDGNAGVDRSHPGECAKNTRGTSTLSSEQSLVLQEKVKMCRKGEDLEALVASGDRLNYNAMLVGAGLGNGYPGCTVDPIYFSPSTSFLGKASLSKTINLGLAAETIGRKSSNSRVILTKGSGAKFASTSQRRICEGNDCSTERASDNLKIGWNVKRRNVIQSVSNENEIIGADVSSSRFLKRNGLAKRRTLCEHGDTHNSSVLQISKLDTLVALGHDRGTNSCQYNLSKQDFDDKENIDPEDMLVVETAKLKASKSWRSSMTSKQYAKIANKRLPLAQVDLQQRRVSRTCNSFMKPCHKMMGSKRFYPPIACKKMGASEFKILQDVGRSTAPRRKKQKLTDNEVKPFIYVEAMKISLTILIGLHDNCRSGSDGFKLPRLQVLDSITAKNAHKVCFGRDNSLNCSVNELCDTTFFMGPQELYRCLVDGKHILKKTGATFTWFLNHYRWVVWKLAAMERSFPRLLLAKYLTKDQVIKQVSYRYQRDLNDAKRSILKKVLQRDASFSSCMVLCIAAVLPFPADTVHAINQELPASRNMAIVLTDGWYSVYAVPDALLATVLWKLNSKSSLVGTKLAIWNAALHNSVEGIDPLDCAIVHESEWKHPLLATNDLNQWPYLQLRYNSTRRVRFDTRLGAEKLHYINPTKSRHRKQPHLSFSLLKSVPLKSLEVDGGMVRSVRVRATRVHPVLYLQSKEWSLGPRIVCEEQLSLYFQLRSEYARAVKQQNCKQNDLDSRTGDWSCDDQIDVPLPIPFIKVDVECTHSNSGQGTGYGILTIWRPSEDLLSGGLQEGAEYYVSSLSINWKVGGERGQDAFLRLSSTKHSGFEEVNDGNCMTDDKARDGTPRLKQSRVCVDVQQATTDFRTNFEEDVNGRRNVWRLKIDICVCIVLIASQETQNMYSSATAKQSEVSLLDSKIKLQEFRYVEHVFVTDLSCHLMSIRVSGMEVSIPKMKKPNNTKSPSFPFRRGSKNIWKEGSILCLSGLEVSHYDEQLRVLDCVLVESTQIVANPSKGSIFWNHFQLLQREVGMHTFRDGKILQTSLTKELVQLKKYVEREILQTNSVPSQKIDGHHVEVAEQERLTQDLQAHEEEGGSIKAEQEHGDVSFASQMWSDARVERIMLLVGLNSLMFSHGVIAVAYVSMGTSNTALQTLYLTRRVMLTMQSLLQQAVASKPSCNPVDEDNATNTSVVQNVVRMLCTHRELHGDYAFCFTLHQVTDAQLTNSWKPWQRLHSSYWMAETVEASQKEVR